MRLIDNRDYSKEYDVSNRKYLIEEFLKMYYNTRTYL